MNKVERLVLIFFLAYIASTMILDHMRLAQVRQLLVDHGMPIEMDQKNR